MTKKENKSKPKTKNRAWAVSDVGQMWVRLRDPQIQPPDPKGSSALLGLLCRTDTHTWQKRAYQLVVTLTNEHGDKLNVCMFFTLQEFADGCVALSFLCANSDCACISISMTRSNVSRPLLPLFLSLCLSPSFSYPTQLVSSCSTHKW
jgi:hypothetical protein